MSAINSARDHALGFRWHQDQEDIPENVAQRLDFETLLDVVSELAVELREAEPVDDTQETSAPESNDASVWKPPSSLLDLTLSLRSAVLGQDAAVGAVAERVAVSLAGLKLRPRRPHGVILLNGPSGTGKTTLAHQLAHAAYNDADAVIRLDMSEYADAADARMKLIGASRVWKNSTREGLLTTRVAENPRSVVLLDEFEKAHPSVWPLFLQAFDDGRLTDGWGTEASFAETIIVMTTNLGADPDSQTPDDVFPKELLGRLDVNVAFEPLSTDTVNQITAKEVREVVRRVARLGWRIDVDDDVTSWLAKRQSDSRLGVRGLHRNVERLLMAPLIAFEEQSVRVRVRADGAALTFRSPHDDVEMLDH